MPNAVRGTLNGLALDVKKNTMPAETERTFVNRSKNFFKANSRVQFASGMNVNSMESVVGFMSRTENQAVENLEQQEHGGRINSRAFVPTDKSRTGASNRKMVQKRNRLGAIKNIVKVADAKGANDGQRFIKSVIHAGIGGFILNKDMIFRVDGFKRNAGKYWKFKLTPVYSYKKGRTVRVEGTGFMERATMKTMKKVDAIWAKEADYHFRKYYGS